MPKQDWSDFVEVGEITAPHGVHGALRVFPTTDFPRRLLTQKTLWVDSLPGPQAVHHAQLHPPIVIVLLEAITTRQQAETLRGASLYVPIRELPSLEPGEYYWFQLQGLTVRDGMTQEIIGTLRKVIRTGANQDVFEVIRPEKPPLLLPALKSVVLHVDLEAHVMEVRVPEGLDDAP